MSRRQIEGENAVEIKVPEPSDVLAGIANVPAKIGDDKRTIADWRDCYCEELRTARQKPSLSIFNRFVNSLLERAMSGESWQRRLEVFQKTFVSFEAVTDESVSNALDEVGYRFPNDGLAVVMKAKEIVTAPTFTWSSYIEEAEKFYETDFPNDQFLLIKNVAFKTRDLALSELSDHFAAMDLHVVRVITRTGLLVHGYGNKDISTNVSEKNAYMFFHNLILKLARRTGWPESGYSPGEIDRMIWSFGRTLCKARPNCVSCPLAGSCLTSRAH
jgi:endonuclease III